jgi:hypothetical protein
MISFNGLGQQGRLGNQLFQYAFLRTTARRLGVPFYCPPWAGDSIFLLDDEGERSRVAVPAERSYCQPHENCGFVESALRIENGTDISGYFQSERYFDRAEVNRWYTFRPDVVRDVREQYRHLDFAEATAVHVRFGDMAHSLQYVVPRPTYYARALSRVPKRRHVLVFSDDVARARAHLRSLPKTFVFIEGNRDFEDLYLITRCRDVVCSTSTFSWWGAWLNEHPDHVVIAPPEGLRPGHPVRCPDFCCKGWIPMRATRPLIEDYRVLVWKRAWMDRLARATGRTRELRRKTIVVPPQVDPAGDGSDPFRFFDSIYCINLDTRPDRWAEACREFQALGIAHRVERVPAIAHPDGREGCRLSHLECVRRASLAGAETVLIFEDDVTFPDFAVGRLARSLARLRTVPDWDVFYLGGLVQAVPTERHEDLFRAPVAQTHAYAVHRRAYAVIQKASIPFDLWCAQHLKSYCARPMLAWQRDGESDIERAWTSRGTDARQCYDGWLAKPDLSALRVPGRLRRRLLVLRARRRLGLWLVRLATLLGVHLRVEHGRPRFGRRSAS